MTAPYYPGIPAGISNLTLDNIGQFLRQIATVVNRINRGKVNAVLSVTLTESVASTEVVDSRLTPFSGVAFDPMTANAAAELAAGTMYVAEADRETGAWTITHANNAQTDRKFRMVVVG